MFKLLKDCISLLRPIPVSVCEELLSQPDNNTAVIALTLNYDILRDLPNFDVNFSCDDMFM